MHTGIVVAQSKCHSVGGAAMGRRMQVRHRHRNRPPAPVQGGAAEVQPVLPTQRADGCGAQFTDALLAPDLGRFVHATRTAASSISRSKQRWKYSATIGRSESSHLLTNDSWKATPTSPKITTFSAHVITVRGDINVDRSPT